MASRGFRQFPWGPLKKKNLKKRRRRRRERYMCFMIHADRLGR